MMKKITIEEIIDTLPTILTREVEDECVCCHKKENRELKYELRMEIQPHEGGKRYKFYYRTFDAHDPALSYFGDLRGWGFKTIKEAVEYLKNFLIADEWQVLIVKEKDAFIVEDKYLIDRKTGTVFYTDTYTGERGDIPERVFSLRDKLMEGKLCKIE